MKVRHHVLWGVTTAATLALGAQATHAAPIWSADFETDTHVPGHASRTQAEFHGGEWSADAVDNTSHWWTPGFGGSVAMPTLAPGQTYSSFTFSFWVKPNNPATQNGLSYQVGLKPVDSSQTETGQQLGYGNSTSAEQWQFVSVDFTAAMNTAYAAGARSIDSFFIAGTSTGYQSYDNFYLDDVAFDVAVVPEPASFSLLGLGGLALLARRRRA